MIISSPVQLSIVATEQRKKLGLTQSEVAEMVGLKQKTISNFENNPEKVMLSTAFAILAALEMNLKVIPKGTKILSNKWAEEW